MLEKIEKFQILILGSILALALIIATGMVASSLSKNVISVTGSYSQNVISDKGIIEISIKSRKTTKAEAYNTLDKNVPLAVKYIQSQGFKPEEIEVGSQSSYEIYETNYNGYSTNNVVAYNATQRITVTSSDVEKIKKLSNSITSLINKGIDLSADEPNYYYSKLADLKVEMLEKATLDAKQRAASMLKATNNRVGKINSVRMGVFQITPVDSTNVSDSGINDTSTIEKKITSVSNVTFRVK